MLLVYDDLRALAAKFMGRERLGHTLDPTALVHEAYLRLIDQTRMEWQGRTHFLALAATTLRRVLVNHALAQRAEKRGGDQRPVTLTEDLLPGSDRSLDLLALEEILQQLSASNPRRGRVVEMRFFGGLSVKETAEILGVSERTVKDDWRFARAWLLEELQRDEAEP
jgi:RNA polymerase sigma factor (TIGR02999 family)